MSFLKLNGCAGAVLMALAVLIASSPAARADTTTLICNIGDHNQTSPTTIDLDETNGTATINSPAVQLPNISPPTVLPAHSAGPYAAKFDEKTIIFETHDEFHKIYTINRLTGITAVDGSYPSGGAFHADWTCQVGKAKF